MLFQTYLGQKLVLCVFFLIGLAEMYSVAPTWTTSHYLRAGNDQIISTRTGNDSTPAATLTFSSAFSNVPNICYGIQKYKGNDPLASEMFQVNMTGITSSSFSVLIQIHGYTNINLMTISYLAVDINFPHHLNSFDNVPINYNAGALTDINAYALGYQTYINTINYTLQAAGRNFTTFANPSRTRISLFLTSLYVRSYFVSKTAPQQDWVPLDMNIVATVISVDEYTFSATVGDEVNISRLHCSMIIYDEEEIESSKLYQLITDKIDFNKTGGFFSVPVEFTDNLIMGFLDFDALRKRTIIDFQWDYSTVSGDHGILVQPFNVPSDEKLPPERVGFTLLYLKTWYCSNDTVLTFYNITSGMCEQCPVVGCLICSTLYACRSDGCSDADDYNYNATTQICDACAVVGCTDCDPDSTTCATCNNTDMYFLNTATSTCFLCTLSNCIICSSQTACQTCETGYTLNSGTEQCFLCTLTGCTTCTTATTCQTCDTNYTLNSGTEQCFLCTLTGCMTCTTATTCQTCDTGYSLNSGTEQCFLCTLTGCATCATITTCQICSQSYFLNGSELCESCQPHCLSCLSASICTTCDNSNSYFLNSSSTLCELCTIGECLLCSSLDSCLTCNQTNGYFINATSLICEPCSVNFCLQCDTLTTCIQCDSSNQTFINSSDYATCYPCGVNHCVTCSSLLSCTLCDEQNDYFVDGSQQCEACSLLGCTNCTSLTSCEECNETDQYFLNQSSFLCVQCPLSNCLRCEAIDRCEQCDEANGYFLNLTTHQCELCSLYQCTLCSSLSQCSQCNTAAQYFLNYSDYQCVPCSLQGCLTCETAYSCQTCDNANDFYFDLSFSGVDPNGQNMSICGTCNVSCVCDGYFQPWDGDSCQSVCGDGLIRVDETCDDVNNVSEDGCSSSCQEQPYYNCTGQPSNCTQTLYFQTQLKNVQRLGCNSLTIEVKYAPFLPLEEMQQTVSFPKHNIQVKGLSLTSENHLFIQAEFYEDIHGLNITMLFEPGQSLYFVYSPAIAAVYQTQQQCESVKAIEQLVMGMAIVSYLVLFTSLLSTKIVGLQLFGLLQLSYFTLSDNVYLVPSLAPIVNFSIFNGFNGAFKSDGALLPSVFQEMGVNSSYLNNVNVMLFLTITYLLLSSTFYFIAVKALSLKLVKIAEILLKQGMLTLVLFNALNFSFSSAVHNKFAKDQGSAQVLNVCLIAISTFLCIGVLLSLWVCKRRGFGEYRDKFKNGWVARVYIPGCIAFRLGMGYLIASESDYDDGTLLPLFLMILFLAFCLINLPFGEVHHNYRSNIILVGQLIILFVTNYYRGMKSNDPVNEISRIQTPVYIELGVIAVCIFLSMVIAVYDIVKYFRRQQRLQREKLKERENSESHAQISQFNETIN